ncbi:MAG: hypothetical protein MRY83_10315 [Flavobacteriales bacterium]|nr:hypothetical protein [Flavobacteriales bacterium]
MKLRITIKFIMLAVACFSCSALSAQQLNPGMIFVEDQEKASKYLKDMNWEKVEAHDGSGVLYTKKEKNGTISFLNYEKGKMLHLLRNKPKGSSYVKSLSYDDILEVKNTESDFYKLSNQSNILKKVVFHNPSKSAESSTFYSLVDASLGKGRNLTLIDNEVKDEPVVELSEEEVSKMLEVEDETKELEIENANVENNEQVKRAQAKMLEEITELEKRNAEMDQQMTKDAEERFAEEQRIQDELQQEIEAQEKAAFEASQEVPSEEDLKEEEVKMPKAAPLKDPQAEKK